MDGHCPPKIEKTFVKFVNKSCVASFLLFLVFLIGVSLTFETSRPSQVSVITTLARVDPPLVLRCRHLLGWTLRVHE